MSVNKLRDVGSQFKIKGDFTSAAPYGSGHINDTYAATYIHNESKNRYIHQRINDYIFKDIKALMQNINRVTKHLRNKLVNMNVDDVPRRTLTVVETKDGASFLSDNEANFWRTYLFIEGAQTYDVLQSERQAFEAARSLGLFQNLLSDLPGSELNVTIPDFHNTLLRFNALKETIKKDHLNRAINAKSEIDFALKLESLIDRLSNLFEAGKLPQRVTHNDTKLNNFMLDDNSGEGLCLIDLDTVMTGTILYDFGDLVRSTTNSAAEDEIDLSKVNFSSSVFEALVNGYLETANEMLTPPEIDNLVFSGILMTYECGIRFLADFLEGDRYFHVGRKNHNLDRCRTQFKLISEMKSCEEKMEEIVRLNKARFSS